MTMTAKISTSHPLPIHLVLGEHLNHCLSGSEEHTGFGTDQVHELPMPYEETHFILYGFWKLSLRKSFKWG